MVPFTYRDYLSRVSRYTRAMRKNMTKYVKQNMPSKSFNYTYLITDFFEMVISHWPQFVYGIQKGPMLPGVQHMEKSVIYFTSKVKVTKMGSFFLDTIYSKPLNRRWVTKKLVLKLALNFLGYKNYLNGTKEAPRIVEPSKSKVHLFRALPPQKRRALIAMNIR